MTCSDIGTALPRPNRIRGQSQEARRQRTNKGRCPEHGIHLNATAITDEAVQLCCSRSDCAYSILYPRAFAPREWVAGIGHITKLAS